MSSLSDYTNEQLVNELVSRETQKYKQRISKSIKEIMQEHKLYIPYQIEVLKYMPVFNGIGRTYYSVKFTINDCNTMEFSGYHCYEHTNQEFDHENTFGSHGEFHYKESYVPKDMSNDEAILLIAQIYSVLSELSVDGKELTSMWY